MLEKISITVRELLTYGVPLVGWILWLVTKVRSNTKEIKNVKCLLTEHVQKDEEYRNDVLKKLGDIAYSIIDIRQFLQAVSDKTNIKKKDLI